MLLVVMTMIIHPEGQGLVKRQLLTSAMVISQTFVFLEMTGYITNVNQL